MARAFNARVQIPWQDFVEKYTYPKVFFDIKEGNTEKTIGSCVADALADEFKELGQDILDEVFRHWRCNCIFVEKVHLSRLH